MYKTIYSCTCCDLIEKVYESFGKRLEREPTEGRASLYWRRRGGSVHTQVRSKPRLRVPTCVYHPRSKQYLNASRPPSPPSILHWLTRGESVVITISNRRNAIVMFSSQQENFVYKFKNLTIKVCFTNEKTWHLYNLFPNEKLSELSVSVEHFCRRLIWNEKF